LIATTFGVLGVNGDASLFFASFCSFLVSIGSGGRGPASVLIPCIFFFGSYLSAFLFLSISLSNESSKFIFSL